MKLCATCIKVVLKWAHQKESSVLLLKGLFSDLLYSMAFSFLEAMCTHTMTAKTKLTEATTIRTSITITIQCKTSYTKFLKRNVWAKQTAKKKRKQKAIIKNDF